MTHALAQKIADMAVARLFRNGAGQQALRLVIELPHGQDGGGWCRAAVADQIRAAVLEATTGGEG